MAKVTTDSFPSGFKSCAFKQFTILYSELLKTNLRKLLELLISTEYN